jgi:NAD(P)H dehydrogenase (quinone)
MFLYNNTWLKMKKALIVFVHPEARSLNGHLKDITVRVLQELNYEVTVSDLYADNFKPLFEKSDFPFYQDEIFSPGKANGMAVALDQLSADVRREKERLTEAELIVFQFPVWWFSGPSMLHAYFERVLLPGWAYHTEKPALEGKRVLISATTGGTKEQYVPGIAGTLNQALHHFLVGTFAFMKMQVIEPIVLYNAVRSTDEERVAAIAQFETEIRDIENRPLFKPGGAESS